MTKCKNCGKIAYYRPADWQDLHKERQFGRWFHRKGSKCTNPEPEEKKIPSTHSPSEAREEKGEIE